MNIDDIGTVRNFFDYWSNEFPEISNYIDIMKEDYERLFIIENKHGEWIESFDGYDTIYTCSVCKEDFVTFDGTPVEIGWNFCPNCGADMREIYGYN